MKAHPTAIIGSRTEIHESVEIGPHVIIEDHVKIGAGTRILANAIVRSHTTIGEGNQIHYGTVIGHEPQDVSFKPECVSYVEIGNNNRIRELVTIHRGSKEGGRTVIGNDNFIFAQSHIAHDVKIADRVVMANFAALGGHATVGDRAFISGGVMIHQFVTIGRLVMISGNSAFSRDLPPFVTAIGQNIISSVNVVGMRRAGISREAMHEVRQAYEIFFGAGGTRDEGLARVEAAGFQSTEVREILEFIRGSRRTIAHHHRYARKGYLRKDLLDLPGGGSGDGGGADGGDGG